MTQESIDSSAVMSLAGRYGELDGEIVYYYTMHMVRASQGLSSDQRSRLSALADSLGYTNPPGAFLYSQAIAMPTIPDTDFLFDMP